MCGIAGFIGHDPRLDEALLRRLLDAQAHRGPDDRGILFREEPGGDGRPPLRVGMAHNRLSILDLSAAGHQPMGDDGGVRWICYNGEFYNSPGERNVLKQQGETFRSSSDTEVLLRLCANLGVEKAVTRVNGMFAFGYYDAEARTLTLCRDRAGQKPLFYLMLPDGSLVYASEIPALLATGLVNADAIDIQAFDQYWTLGYTAGERTFYPSIRRLRPGHLAHWKDGALELRAYWQVVFDPADAREQSPGNLVEEGVELIQDAVKLRLLSDVPVGLCLSGGLDSSLMALMISRLRADVPAYTIAFEGTPEDEAGHARAIADHLGLEHRVLNVSGDLAHEFGRIAAWYGEPFGDASSIPMYFLSRMIREHATVALTGDGGDELFGGYHHYREGMRLWGRRRFQGSSCKLQGAGCRQMARDLVLRGLGVERGYPRMQRHVNERLKRRIYSEGALAEVRRSGMDDPRRRWLAATSDPLAAMQNCDFHVYMTDDVHTKVDRMSMAHALECRSPLMDYRVIEWAARLPTSVKISTDGKGKVILREMLARFMPGHLYDRPKQGFTPPWETWCEGVFRKQLRDAWVNREDRWLREGAIDLLVPESGPVSPVLSWVAYAYGEWRRGG